MLPANASYVIVSMIPHLSLFGFKAIFIFLANPSVPVSSL